MTYLLAGLEHISGKFGSLHVDYSIGMLYSRQGQLQQAHAALTAAGVLYRDMDMTFWLPQAEATLAQMV